MNYVISPKKTPPVSITSGGLDEMDGATGGDTVLMDGVCSKTSVTSVSSTSKFPCTCNILAEFINISSCFRHSIQGKSEESLEMRLHACMLG